LVFANRYFHPRAITFRLPFPAARAINRHALSQRRKGYPNTMTTVETNTTDKAAAVAAQSAHVAPDKAPAKNVASQKHGVPKAQKTANGAKHGAKAKAAPKKVTMHIDPAEARISGLQCLVIRAKGLLFLAARMAAVQCKSVFLGGGRQCGFGGRMVWFHFSVVQHWYKKCQITQNRPKNYGCNY
jgi:hypothetical protein